MANLPNYVVLELLGLTPLPYALQAKYVIAVGQNAETSFTARFLHDPLEAYSTRFVLGTLQGGRVLQMLLILSCAFLWKERLRNVALERRSLESMAESYVQFDAPAVESHPWDGRNIDCKSRTVRRVDRKRTNRDKDKPFEFHLWSRPLPCASHTDRESQGWVR